MCDLGKELELLFDHFKLQKNKIEEEARFSIMHGKNIT